jgi:hypothetical protein
MDNLEFETLTAEDAEAGSIFVSIAQAEKAHMRSLTRGLKSLYER